MAVLGRATDVHLREQFLAHINRPALQILEAKFHNVGLIVDNLHTDVGCPNGSWTLLGFAIASAWRITPARARPLTPELATHNSDVELMHSLCYGRSPKQPQAALEIPWLATAALLSSSTGAYLRVLGQLGHLLRQAHLFADALGDVAKRRSFASAAH